MIWIILLVVFVLCFLIYQWWFIQSRYRNMTDTERNRIKTYQRPIAYAIYSAIVFLVLVILVSIEIKNLMDAIMQLNY